MAGVDAETLRHIQANAAMVVEQMQKLSGTTFGYDEASVAWLDGYISRNRADLAPPVVERLAMMFASYLGECIIHCYGGSWGRTDSELGVEFDTINAVFPFSKVRKQFANGEEDSISSFFKTIPIVFAGRVKMHEPGRHGGAQSGPAAGVEQEET